MSRYFLFLSFLPLLFLFLSPVSFIAASGREYSDHELVDVMVNTVGPFHNPAESYKYYSLPYCSPKLTGQSIEGDDDNLGEALAGDRRRSSLYRIHFGVNKPWDSLCKIQLSQNEIKEFIDAIRSHYIFELFVDDLSVKGFVGEMEETHTKISDKHIHKEQKIYLFTHLDFSIARNGPHVIAVNLTTFPEQRVELEFGESIEVEFSYSVRWIDTKTSFVDRQTLHSRSAIGEQAVEIHWLSIINSFVLVILLTAFLGVVLVRVLHKDFARYMELDDEELNEEESKEESGWKLVHGDVFRFPQWIMLFTAALGNGAQILVLVICILLLALFGTFYPGNRGAVYSAAVFLYALTAYIAGYVATWNYLLFGGQKWASNSVLTASLFAGPFFITFSILNSVAWYYGSSSALPAMTIIIVILIWALLSFPLTIFGSMRARHAHTALVRSISGVASPLSVVSPTGFEAPCKTNRVEREIPPSPWYRHPLIHLFIAGFLPFSAIYIELHYIFASVWGHRVYTLFGILSLAFLMLIIVTAFITVALTYFQLASEDHRWWWRSFLSGAATGAFMYAYAAFYYIYRSEMHGSLQATFFFGYMLMVSYGFALMLGSVAFFMAMRFVQHIYRSIKVD